MGSSRPRGRSDDHRIVAYSPIRRRVGRRTLSVVSRRDVSVARGNADGRDGRQNGRSRRCRSSRSRGHRRRPSVDRSVQPSRVGRGSLAKYETTDTMLYGFVEESAFPSSSLSPSRTAGTSLILPGRVRSSTDSRRFSMRPSTLRTPVARRIRDVGSVVHRQTARAPGQRFARATSTCRETARSRSSRRTSDRQVDGERNPSTRRAAHPGAGTDGRDRRAVSRSEGVISARARVERHDGEPAYERQNAGNNRTRTGTISMRPIHIMTIMTARELVGKPA